MSARISLDEAWTLASSNDVDQPGEILSSLAADVAGWHQAELPATVLGALVEGGVYPDPYFGTNLREIPGQGPPAQNFSNHDMPGDSPFGVPWWFRKEFRIPADAGPCLRLQLDGINSKADVWLNGQRLGDTLVGTYRVFELDITDRALRDGVNVLALRILAPTPCDLAITWVDWNPSPADKNMGIWRDVWLLSSGPVSLGAPFVTSTVHDGGARASLVIGGDVCNRTDRPQVAVIHAELEGVQVTEAFELAPRETRNFSLPVEVTAPRLWWPRFMGEAALYDLAIDVIVDDVVADRARFAFGIREITSTLTEDGHALYQVNGKPLLIRGAGWATDLLLRRQPERDLAQLEYVKALNLNTIRFEGVLERADFLEWCDREGILVIGGWCCCDCWEKWDRWTEETHVVGAESLRSQIRRVRRHPCMLAWWYGSDFPPPPRVERAYLDVLAEERWPNPHQSSAANKPTEVTGRSGLKMEGPYEYVPPGYWLEDTIRGGAFGFATEISPGAAVPPIQSLEKMLPRDHLWPIDAVWDFHAGGQEFHTVGRFAAAIKERYGETASAAEFAQLSQLVTYEGQRAMFEAYTRNKYKSTGVIQWMLNNAWPSMIWHLHDYFLRPGGGFHGTQKACEPLHVMYSYDDRSIVVTNQYAVPHGGLTVTARVHAGGRTTERVVRDVEVAADGKTTVMVLAPLEHEVTFVDLRLDGRDGRTISSNFYWLPLVADVVDYEKAFWLHTPTAKHADLTALRRLPEATARVRVARERARTVRVELDNVSDRLAFFVQLRLTDATGADVLPVVWSDNYVSLLPGDAKTLRVTAAGGGELPSDVQVEVQGINLRAVTVAAGPDEERQAVDSHGNGHGNGGGNGNGNGHGNGHGRKPDVEDEIVLDDRDGPAPKLPPDRETRLVSSSVEQAYHAPGGRSWGPVRS